MERKVEDVEGVEEEEEDSGVSVDLGDSGEDLEVDLEGVEVDLEEEEVDSEGVVAVVDVGHPEEGQLEMGLEELSNN